MDGNDFDSLTRKLGGLASRRQAVAGLVGAAIAATGLSAAAKNKGKSKKGKAHGFSAKDIRKGKGIGAAACGNVGCLGCSLGGVPDPTTGQCPVGELPVCVPGTFDGQCGSGGAFCTACTGTTICASDPTGNGGACLTPPPQCNPGPFTGQCVQDVNGTATCQNAAGPNACGTAPNGSCLPACTGGQECVTNFGPGTDFICTSSTCAASCPNGCCASANDPINPPGSCQNGDTILACGSGGGICTDCLAVCGLEGSCVNGVCSCTVTQCGAAQQPCCAGNTCLGSNVCNNGLCEAPTCNASNCTGCCQGSTCVTTTSDAQCGINGSTCVACQGRKHCNSSGVCKRKHRRH